MGLGQLPLSYTWLDLDGNMLVELYSNAYDRPMAFLLQHLPSSTEDEAEIQQPTCLGTVASTPSADLARVHISCVRDSLPRQA